MSSQIVATSRFRVFVGLTSALLCHPRFPTADCSSQDNDQHRSHCWSLSISLLDYQFLKMNSHSLTNFAVNRNHVNTIVSHIEVLLFFARDLCSTAQHLVYIRESSIQRSEQSIFDRILGIAKLFGSILAPITKFFTICSPIATFWTNSSSITMFWTRSFIHHDLLVTETSFPTFLLHQNLRIN